MPHIRVRTMLAPVLVAGFSALSGCLGSFLALAELTTESCPIRVGQQR